MPKLVQTTSFKKAFKKFTKGNPTLQLQIFNALELLEKDPFNQQLRTHKLSGKLSGLVACSCGYDCRIVFSFEKLKGEKEEIILLTDIGTHDVVY